MYSYTYDDKTGGLLLNSSPTGFSKEPRPVYATELDVLGFDKYWKYDKQTDYPYMWAEANNYYYRGKLVAKLKGGNIYTIPKIIISTDEDGNPVIPESEGISLYPVDIEAMVDANREMLEIIEQTTVKKILAVYTKYKDKLDCFHVAFSGGKDSCVLLDLVKKALPKNSFMVVFGDTGMEFPDTYDIIEDIKRQCMEDDILFYNAKSHLNPKESWKLFGPPSRVLRWCCSVHKSTPQTLKLREVTGKNDYIGLDFVGVRAQESVARSTYEYENYGAKQQGQYSHNSILEWTSAEIWLYIYANDLLVNESYKKGNGRAGCLFCPMSGGASDYLRRVSYPEEIDGYINLIKNTYDGDKRRKNNVESYVINGGWNARKNGRELADNTFRCIEKTTNEILSITVSSPTSNWLEWIKTIGNVYENDGDYIVLFKGEQIRFSVKQTKNGYVVSISEVVIKERPAFGKIFKQVFRKASYCKGCRVCETNCRNGCISFVDSKIKISDCSGCRECHAIDSGCLLFHSLRHPQGGGISMKSLNSFADHAPKPEWLRSYFELKEAFFSEHSLGPMMFDMFRRFLRDASLNERNHFTPFAELISQIGWQTSTAQGLILINLVAANPQMEWYVDNFDIDKTYTRQIVEDKEVDSVGVFDVIKKYIELVQKEGNEAHKKAVEIGRIAATNHSLADNLSALITIENCQRGMCEFLSSFEGGKVMELATAIGAENNVLTDIRHLFGVKHSCLWDKQIGEDEIHKLLTEYSVVKASNNILNTITHSLNEAYTAWRERLNFIGISSESLRLKYSALGKIFDTLLKICRQEDIMPEQVKILQMELLAHGAEVRELLNNDRHVFAEAYEAYLEDLSADDIAAVKAVTGVGLFELPKTDCNIKVRDAVEKFRKDQLKSQLFRLWKDQTKTKNPYEWSNHYKMPILCLVPVTEFDAAKKAFDILNRNWGTDLEIKTALAFLETTTMFSILSDEERRNAAFKREIIGPYITLFPDLDKVKDALDHLSVDVYDWRDNPGVRAKIYQLADAEYNAGGSDKALTKIDEMDDAQLKQYLKRLVKDSITVGLEILANGG